MAAFAAFRLTARAGALLGLLISTGPLRAELVRLEVPPGTDSVALTSGPVLAGSEVIRAGSDTLQPALDYAFADDFAWLRLQPARTETVYVEYAVISHLGGTYRRFAPLTQPDAVGPVPAARRLTPVAAHEGSLDIAGSKKFSFGFGRDRGGLVEQSLWLSIRGKIGPKLTVEGTIADRSIATGAITRRPSEFDKLSLRAYGPGFDAEFGDTELRRADFSLFNMSRRLSGMRASGRTGAFRGGGLLGERRGQYRSHRFYGEEGKQGPYFFGSGNRIAVVPGSEIVWVDGELLRPGVERDYEIDYLTGALTFTARRPVARESRITVDYEVAADDYASFVYQAGAGVEHSGWNIDWLLHREWDDPGRPRGFVLSDADREVLRQAGDSPDRAVRSGVDSVGAGNGLYKRDSLRGFYFFAGPNRGEFNITFSYVGPSSGDYRALGDGTYFYVGANLGDYAPVVVLPLPTENRMFAVRAGRTGLNHRLQLELAQTLADPNRLSDFSDVTHDGAAWLGRYEFGHPEQALGAAVFWRHRDASFQAPGRDLGVEYNRRWGDELEVDPGGSDEVGTQLRFGRGSNGVRLELEGRDAGIDDRAWRTAGTVELGGRGGIRADFDLLRRTRTTLLEFDRASLAWRLPTAYVPMSVRVSGERRVDQAGYRFAEVGTSIGPAHLNVNVAYRRTDSLNAFWLKQSDLYRASGQWLKAGPTLDGGLTIHYERREFTHFQTGSQDRLLAESRWLVRRRGWVVRVEHRLSRTQALSAHEEFIPVEPGRGDYRRENGQIIEDPLGDLIRVIRPSAYGDLARQSEKRANVVWQPRSTGIRAEFDLVTAETAGDAQLPPPQWFLPWHVEPGSPTQRRALRGELSGRARSLRWVWRGQWDQRIDVNNTRPQHYRRLASDVTVRSQTASPLRLEVRGGGGTQRDRAIFPYDFIFAHASFAPAWRPFEGAEVVLPLFGQRYWETAGDLLADWQRVGVRGVMRLGRRSRVVVEPSLNHIRSYQLPLPLAVADGRAVGTSSDWRVEGALDLSGAVVSRLIYRGRSEPGRPAVHRADLSVEATF